MLRTKLSGITSGLTSAQLLVQAAPPQRRMLIFSSPLCPNVVNKVQLYYAEMSKFVLNQVIRGNKGFYRLLKSLTPHIFQAKIEGTSDL
jgi:hypothetical protein